GSRPGRANDVGGIGSPWLRPAEALSAHPVRQNRHPATAKNARYGNAAAAVISGRRPHRTVMRRIKLSADQAGHQTRIGGEHLVRTDEREAPAHEYHDRCLHAGKRLRENHVAGHGRSTPPVGIIEPMNPPQIFLIGLIPVDRFETALAVRRNERRIGELAPRWQGYLRPAQALDRRSAALAVDDFRLDEERTRHVAEAAPQPMAAARQVVWLNIDR